MSLKILERAKVYTHEKISVCNSRKFMLTKKVLKPYIFGKFSVFSPKYIKYKPFYKITVYKTRYYLFLTIEELSLINHNNKNFDHDEREDEKKTKNGSHHMK